MLDIVPRNDLRFPKPHPLSMESVAIAEPVRNGPSLTNLPRETRNQIYRYLLVSSKPIKVCYNDKSSRLQNYDVSIEFLCYAVKGS